jgi:hypothetical protein
MSLDVNLGRQIEFGWEEKLVNQTLSKALKDGIGDAWVIPQCQQWAESGKGRKST